ELEPCAIAGVGRMIDSRRVLAHKFTDRARQIVVPSRAAALVVYNLEFPARCHQTQNRIRETSSFSAEQPGCAHDTSLGQDLQNSIFALRLTGAIHVDWSLARDDLIGR